MVTSNEIMAACEKYGSQRAAAKALGIPRTTMMRRLEGIQPKIPIANSERVVVDEKGDEASVTATFDHAPTVEEILSASGLDPKVWRIESHTRSEWTVTMKVQGEPTQVTNWSVKARCTRINPKIVEDVVNDLYSKLRLDLPSPKRSKKKASHLLEISICDVHLGKRCWAQETGENQDLGSAVADYMGSVDDLLDKASIFAVDKIVIPIGGDLLHVDDTRSQTHSGTVVDSTDDRLSKVWSAGLRCVQYAISQAREIAEVDVLFVPGNHDTTSSHMLSMCVSALYENDKHVSIDASPIARKYRKFGCSMMGYTHGNGIALNKLPLLMAVEQPDFWSSTQFRSWRCGHFHKRASTSYVSTDTVNGVRIDILPSISCVDLWHYTKGFVKNIRSSEMWAWDFSDGYVGHFSAISRSQKVQLIRECV